jgi:hypothetical protein
MYLILDVPLSYNSISSEQKFLILGNYTAIFKLKPFSFLEIVV